MRTIWFKHFGWIYIPVHRMGYFITLLAVLFMVPVCVAVIRDGHPVAHDLYSIFVAGTCTAFWWKWVAEKTSEERIK